MNLRIDISENGCRRIGVHTIREITAVQIAGFAVGNTVQIDNKWYTVTQFVNKLTVVTDFEGDDETVTDGMHVVLSELSPA